MKINNVHHIAVNTRSFEKSIQFYTEVLKLKFLNEVNLGGDYVAYIEYAENSVLELFRMDEKLKECLRDDSVVGLKHIAFNVEGIAEWNEYLKQLEIPFKLELTQIPPIRKNVLLIEAPDNVIVELCESY